MGFYILIFKFFGYGRHQVVRFYMRWSDFRRGDLRRCDLRRCDLKRCVLKRCDWRRVDLRRCDLRRCYARRCNARRCNYLPFSSIYPKVRTRESIDSFCFFFLVLNLLLLDIFLFFLRSSLILSSITNISVIGLLKGIESRSAILVTFLVFLDNVVRQT